MQARLSSSPRSRVLARLAPLAQIGELARRLHWWKANALTTVLTTLAPLYLFYDKESLNLRSGPILAVLIILVATAKIGPDANFLTFVLVTASSWP